MQRGEDCEGGERQREGEKEMKTKKESEPGGEKRTEIGLEGKKEKIDAILRQAGGGESW